MKLEKVKYRKCIECGRGFPGAHVVANMVKGHKDYLVDDYKAHRNKRCPMCIRAEIERLKNNGSRGALARVKKLQRMVAA